LELFHNELGKPEDKRKKNSTPVSFGKIPYLNGGLFDIHELESAYTKIAIEDKAFERIFAFFDKWNWHLDTRITASGRDINPDVIGYIFEKYINQKEMGAYYTKEDITDYIGKNTIIPFLLDKVKSNYPAPFESGGGFWQYLQDNADEYIYDSVKKGGEGKASINEVNIPENIKNGIDTSKPNLLERRKDWNIITPEDIGLPTEIWRETIARLQRYFELRKNISKGKIQEINDLITYNLNIRKLIQDFLEQTQDSMFVRKFFIALTEITILDPTCGSGAFLFAALNILEPLYEVCIHRMEKWLEANPKGNKDFGDRLTSLHLSEHTSLSYFIYKTIILKNLYGVDLMKEAVEIAKLRLFLKLVAEVDPSHRLPNYGLEPLPDIDFNIRSGNTLVGFATEQQLEEVIKNTEGIYYEEKLDGLKTKCDFVKEAYNHFQKIQTQTNSDSIVQKESKKNLIKELKELDETLNRYLSETYGLGKDTQWKSQKEKDKAYNEWKESHQPFHWFAEFYGIISKGGFDVVIGNPPYVAFSKINYNLIEQQYQCYPCKDIFALVLECAKMLSKNGNHGFIIPLSGFSVDGMQSLRNLYIQKSKFIWNSYYSASAQPSTLFNGVRHRLQIIISNKNKDNANCQCYTTNFIKWFSNERDVLFNTCLNYVLLRDNDTKKEKISNLIELTILDKIHINNNINEFIVDDGLQLFYHNAPVSWHKVFNFIPFYSESGIVKQSSHLKSICFPSEEYLSITLCLLNSSLFYWYNWHFSNCRDLSSKDILGMKLSLDKISDSNVKELKNLSSLLMEDLKSHSKIYKRVSKGIKTEFDSFYPMFSKPIIDKIDKVLAKHYGFTEEELDFIINYDIKYRMGSELEGEE
jgi:tRNA1(Val) A37 N6-methylase TrmN6